MEIRNEFIAVISGKVLHGRRLGRSLGFPTANLSLDTMDGTLPPDGVYLSRASIDGDPLEYWALVNIGTRPSVESGAARNAEAWIFDFERQIYDCRMTLKLIEHLRDERRFANLDELKMAMEQDKINALNIIKQHEYSRL